jgi:DNA-binding LacI/PurR family transcriptional regulator
LQPCSFAFINAQKACENHFYAFTVLNFRISAIIIKVHASTMPVVRDRTAKTAAGRPPERQTAIVCELRRQIVSGKWAPGSRLPNRSEIERDFAASSLTVQRALDLLVKDGFVCVRGRMGSYVAAEPPHLSRIAFVFNSRPGRQWGQFNQALFDEANRLVQEGARQIAVYQDVDGHEDSEDYQRLLRDIAAHRISALIYATVPFFLEGTPLLTELSLPSVAIGSRPPGKMHAASPDQSTFWTRALEFLAQSGRKQVAVIGSPHSFHREKLRQSLAEHGLNSRPYWQFHVGLDHKEVARDIMHLLFHPGQCERPDALIVGDDNLLTWTAKGVLAAGLPEDLEILTHCNFPNVAPSAVPVRRLGFDVREVLGACLETLDELRSRGEGPRLRTIEARFETELASLPVSI